MSGPPPRSTSCSRGAQSRALHTGHTVGGPGSHTCHTIGARAPLRERLLSSSYECVSLSPCLPGTPNVP
eukprot:5161831-Pyramimonas_sp.AAC.1